MPVPASRLTRGNDRTVRSDGQYVLYWSTAARRTTWNFGLDRALEHCLALKKPLLVLEALRVGHRWASARFHTWVLQGMADNARRYRAAGIAYYPYIERMPDEGKGLVEALAQDAAIVVSDDWPAFFFPNMLRAVGARLAVAFELVDGNGLVPMRAAGRAFPTAYAFRRYLQGRIPVELAQMPAADPLASAGGLAVDVPGRILDRHPPADAALLAADATALAVLPIDHTVAAVSRRGGEDAARAHLGTFLEERLARYDEDRSAPDREGQSGLSPALHWGHLSAHEIVAAVLAHEGFRPDRAGHVTNGSRTGFWALSPSAEAFLDELITWRELGFNFAAHRDDIDRYESLPTWAQSTLAAHAEDARPHRYTLEELAAARTHDPLWNAAQRQLRADGIIHNYLRMLWGKKVLEWTSSPQQAANFLIELNNRFAIDGRDPNSYSGIFWCLGRYDRPWGPLRPIFGSVRYMTSENTAKKWPVKQYLARWADGTNQLAAKHRDQQRSLPLS